MAQCKKVGKPDYELILSYDEYHGLKQLLGNVCISTQKEQFGCTDEQARSNENIYFILANVK